MGTFCKYILMVQATCTVKWPADYESISFLIQCIIIWWWWAKFDVHKAPGDRPPCYPMTVEQLLKHISIYLQTAGAKFAIMTFS